MDGAAATERRPIAGQHLISGVLVVSMVSRNQAGWLLLLGILLEFTYSQYCRSLLYVQLWPHSLRTYSTNLRALIGSHRAAKHSNVPIVRNVFSTIRPVRCIPSFPHCIQRFLFFQRYVKLYVQPPRTPHVLSHLRAFPTWHTTLHESPKGAFLSSTASSKWSTLFF